MGIAAEKMINIMNKKLLTTFLIFAATLFSAESWAQTWNLTQTMTATLDNAGVLTISTTKSEGEAMPDYYDYSVVPWDGVRSNIFSAVIGNNISTISQWAFYGCGSLISATIPNTVTSIGDLAFLNCRSLTSITIPNSVRSIGIMAFAYSGLISLTIPNSVTTIGGGAFNNCTELSSLELSNSLISIAGLVPGTNNVGGTFANCTSLTSVVIPNSVTTIGYYAFGGCTNLATILIPKSATTIESGAFYDCNVKDVTVEWNTAAAIPKVSVPVPLNPNANSPIINALFTNVETATLHVPAGTKALYLAADVWKDFGRIDDGTPAAIVVISNPSLYAFITHNVLKVESPQAEKITIYSAKGTQLYSTTKSAGMIEIPVSSLHGSVLIIKGSVSGTVKVVKR